MSEVKWSIDPAHSTIGFKVKHMMFTNVKGRFENYTATATTQNEDSLENASINFEAQTESISTDNTDRDNHLKSGDFFDAGQYPKISFKSTEVANTGGKNYNVIGNLTIKDVTKPITLKGEFSGKLVDPWGNTKSGLILEGSINRKEFGLNWNSALETGGVLVGEEVKFDIEVQFVKQ
jgi:polyisoprenoid-binding protein YceI